MAVNSEVSEVVPGIGLIDCGFAGLPEQCGVFLVRGERTALIDTGPSGSAAVVVDALELLGVDELDYICLTHLHLDHAGAASHLLERYPSAVLLLHERSIRFLADPERLVKSAERSLGDLAPHYGKMAPVPTERMKPLEDGQEFDLGTGIILTALYTPGHSNGHFAFWEPASRALLCGDALGHFIQADAYVYPATPAPEFDPDISLASATKLAELAPDILLFSHFGVSTDAQAIIRQFQSRVTRFVQIASELPQDKRDATDLAAILMRDFPTLRPDEADLVRGIMRVNAAGILHYLRNSGR